MVTNNEEQQPTQAAAEAEAEAQDEQELTEEELENVVGGNSPTTSTSTPSTSSTPSQPHYNPNDAMAVDSIPTQGLQPLD